MATSDDILSGCASLSSASAAGETEVMDVSSGSTKGPNHVDADSLNMVEIRRLQSELDEARSLVAVANYSLEESLETERRKCKEEVATLRQLMEGEAL